MCRWDLSPAILLLFPADWDCKSPPVTLPWGELAHGFGSSKPDRHWPGQAPREPRSQNADWGEKKKKTKRKRSWSAGALWFVSRGAPQPVGSAAQGALPGEESSALSFSLFHVFLVEPEEHLESSPSLGYHTLKGYERALIWGKNRVCPPWPWWLVLQNECPETGNIWELGITKHLCGPGDLYSAISTSCQRKRQEIIWETEDHI